MPEQQTSSAADRPPVSPSEDRLDRMRWIERLADALIDPNTKKATDVVVAITGPWGSGKTTAMNFLQQHLVKTYGGEALILSFNPWLISGRDDLIRAFFKQILTELGRRSGNHSRLAKLKAAIAKYGEALELGSDLTASTAGWTIPGLDKAIRYARRKIEGQQSRRESLDELRKSLTTAIEEARFPIVILIDEVDRLEEGDVRLIAQLVRSIADFRGISYVLAYDQERVVQALGGGERGRTYLEKIVQYPAALPVLFSEELLSLLKDEISNIQPLPGLPQYWHDDQRFRELWELLAEYLLSTPRDIKRLVGTFNVVERMVRGEVDWVDLFGLSALMTKAPMTMERIRTNIDAVVSDPASAREQMADMLDVADEDDLRFKGICPSGFGESACRPILKFVFPRFADKDSRRKASHRALSRRRNLCTVLRWGLVPGDVSRAEVRELPRLASEELEDRLISHLKANTLDLVFERAKEEFADLEIDDWRPFWQAAARTLKKLDCIWPSAYSPMHKTLYALTRLFNALTEKSTPFRQQAVEILDGLETDGLIELPAYILRQYVFRHGLYGNDKSVVLEIPLFSEYETERRLRSLLAGLPDRHINGTLIPCFWSLMPIYLLLDLGLWSDRCRDELLARIAMPDALDGFTLMLFGGHYSTGASIVEKLIDRTRYGGAVDQRLKSPDMARVDPSVVAALRKAHGEFP